MSFSFSTIANNFNNFFYPFSKEPALHEAFRKSASPKDENFQSLLKNGANVLEKDNQGFTIIDYAVLDGKHNYLPDVLLAQRNDQTLPQKPFAKPINTQLLDKTINQFLSLQNSKSVLEFQKLMRPFAEAIENKTMTSEMQAEFLTFVENNLQKEFGNLTLKFSLIHLLALQSNPELLKIAIEKHPEWLKVTDSQGNCPLHYVALNSDKAAFLELLKNKADLFSTNHNQHTPLDFLIRRIEKADPLAWNRNDVWMFFGALMPSILTYMKERKIVTDEASLDLLSDLSFIISNLSMFGYLKTVLERFQSTPAKALMTLLYLVINQVPVINLPLKAYTFYCFATRAFQTIKASWQHANHRPLTGLAVSAMRTVQVLDCTQDLYTHIRITNWIVEIRKNLYKLPNLFDSVSNNCGEAPPFIVTETSTNEVFPNPKFKTYLDCSFDQFSKVYENELNNNPGMQDFYENQFTPFAKETLAGDCVNGAIKGGEAGFISCATAQFEHYFSKYISGDLNLPATDDAIEKAREIIGVNSSATKKDIKKACRQLYLTTHPDHNFTVGAAENFRKVNEACTLLNKV